MWKRSKERAGAIRTDREPRPVNDAQSRPARIPSFERVTHGISKEMLSFPCNRPDHGPPALKKWLLSVGKDMGYYDTRRVARSLSLKESHTEDIIRNHPNDCEEQRCQAIFAWAKKERGKAPTVQNLIKCIWSSEPGCLGDVTTAELVCKRLKELEPLIKEQQEQGSQRDSTFSRSGDRTTFFKRTSVETAFKVLNFAPNCELQKTSRRVDTHSDEIASLSKELFLSKDKMQSMELEITRQRDELRSQNIKLWRELQCMQGTIATIMEEKMKMEATISTLLAQILKLQNRVEELERQRGRTEDVAAVLPTSKCVQKPLQPSLPNDHYDHLPLLPQHAERTDSRPQKQPLKPANSCPITTSTPKGGASPYYNVQSTSGGRLYKAHSCDELRVNESTRAFNRARLEISNCLERVLVQKEQPAPAPAHVHSVQPVKTIRTTYSYEELLRMTGEKKYPKGVDSTILEWYLSDEEFRTVFQMTREQFFQKPMWKQSDLKRRANLF